MIWRQITPDEMGGAVRYVPPPLLGRFSSFARKRLPPPRWSGARQINVHGAGALAPDDV